MAPCHARPRTGEEHRTPPARAWRLHARALEFRSLAMGLFVPDFRPRAGFACFRPRAVTKPRMDLDHLTLLTDMQRLGVGIPMVIVGGRFPTKDSLRNTAWR